MSTPLAARDFDELPMDVFELVDNGLVVESLTEGHGLTENGASKPGACSITCDVCMGCGGGHCMVFC